MQRGTPFQLLACAISSAVVAATLAAQAKPASPGFIATQEFPVTMRQNVTAGITPVGTKVEAKLSLATLVQGKVVPEGATFVGTVIESAEKSGANPSRLAIRIDTVNWKEGSLSLKAYLTSWYYPIRVVNRDDHKCEAVEGLATRCPHSHHEPRDASGEEPATISGVSDQRSRIKGIDVTRLSDGTVVLTSDQFNIKLEKTTTYVLATTDLKSAR